MTKLAYSAHQLNKENIKALGDAVIVHNMNFDARITQTGLILPSDNGQSRGIRPRWGQVYAVGPDQTDVKVGTWVCVAHGRWTRGIEVEDENGKQMLRRVDPDDIFLQADEEPQDLTFSGAIHIDKKPDHMLHV